MANLSRHGAAFSEQLHQMLGGEEGGTKPQLPRLAYNGLDCISATRYIYCQVSNQTRLRRLNEQSSHQCHCGTL